MTNRPLVQGERRAVAAHYFTHDFTPRFRQRDSVELKSWLPGSSACHDVYWDAND